MNRQFERHGFKIWLGILPGWNWLDRHEHDWDEWRPSFKISRPGFKCSVQLKDNSKLREVVNSIIK